MSRVETANATSPGRRRVHALVLLILASAYSLTAASVNPRPNDAPVSAVVIDLGREQISRDIRARVAFSLFDGQHTIRCKAEMSVRGSSSAHYAKKPYRLELQDENGDDLKVSLLGMSRESDWILFPAYTDKTMIRDVLAYELWRRIGYWAPRTRYVDLFIVRTNTASQTAASLDPQLPNSLTPQPSNSYEGVYVLMEKIKRGKERLNIAKLTSGDTTEPSVTGGYILKRDRTNSPTDKVFQTTKKVEFIWEEPKPRDLTPEQEHYLTNYMNEFETVLFGDNFGDPVNGYRKYIDVDSFVDYHWMQEVGKNPDGYWFSQFYHKDRGGKLKMGPIWDWDLGFGNCTMNNGYEPTGWRWAVSHGANYRWFKRLFDDPDFLQRYIDRWSELRTNVLATSNVLALVDRYADELKEVQKRNYSRWPTMGKKIGPVKFVGQTYEEEVNFLKRWLKERLEWIDGEDFPKPAIVVDRSPTLNSQPSTLNHFDAQPSTLNSQPSVIRMACLTGKIYYTVDGTDPRLAGGPVSGKATEYTAAIPVAPGFRLFARVRSDFGLWSAPVTFAE